MRLPKTLLLLIETVVSGNVLAQTDSLVLPGRYSAEHTAELIGLGAPGDRTPFWIRANQYGIVPPVGTAGLLRIGTVGQLRSTNRHPNRQLTYGVEAVGVVGQQVSVVLPQAYVSLDRGRFSLWAGRKKEIIGLGDSALTSGFYSWSGNALPVTKVQMGTNGFAPVGFTKGLIAINAFLGHGWFPNTDSIRGSYLHQKVLYGRIGKPNWKVKLYAGIVHSAQWGGKSGYRYRRISQNDGQLPSSFQDYVSVIVARQPIQEEGNNITEHDALNRVGNHVGSIDMGVDVDLRQWTLRSYYQHPFEDKSGLLFANLPDGLYGLSFKRRSFSPVSSFQINQFVVEYLTTMNQSGWQLPFGLDDYFNNYQYLDGWTRSNRVLGTPFIVTKPEVRPELLTNVTRNRLVFANNQLQLLHLGVLGSTVSGIRAQLKVSVSRNYGIQRALFAQPVHQFSGYLSVVWPLPWFGGTELQSAVAVDYGNLYANASGVWLGLKKTFGGRTAAPVRRSRNDFMRL